MSKAHPETQDNYGGYSGNSSWMLKEIPAELKEHASWMCWRRGALKSDGVRFEKQPVSPKTGYDAAQSKPENWGTFEQAASRVGKHLPDGPDGEQRFAAGVSFVPTRNDPALPLGLRRMLRLQHAHDNGP